MKKKANHILLLQDDFHSVDIDRSPGRPVKGGHQFPAVDRSGTAIEHQSVHFAVVTEVGQRIAAGAGDLGTLIVLIERFSQLKNAEIPGKTAGIAPPAFLLRHFCGLNAEIFRRRTSARGASMMLEVPLTEAFCLKSATLTLAP